MKRIKTRALALLLSCCLVTIGTVGSYQTAQAAEIVAGGAIVGTLEEILLSFGIFLLPSAMTDQAQSSDWWYSEDGNAALKPYYDDLASEYEKERFKVINGGGGDPQPSPTPVPEQKPEIQPTPIPQVKPGEIPTFDELVAPALAGGAISWASGAWDTMAKAVGNLWDKLIDNTPPTTDLKGNKLSSEKLVGKICRHIIFDPSGRNSDLGTSNDVFYLYQCSVDVPFIKLYSARDDKGQYISAFSSPSVNVYYLKNALNGLFDRNSFAQSNLYTDASQLADFLSASYSFDIYVPYSLDGVNHGADAKPATKEEIWVHPDLQETYQNNGKLEYPQEAPQPLQYPSAENLADLAKKLNPEINPDYSPEIAPNYVQELIQKLQQNPSVNPDPNPNPNPNPNPDPGTNPQPTLKPNPTDTPDQPESPEDEVKPYTVDLTKVFPFCIPFDLIHLFKVLDAEPEAPMFKIPIELQVDNPFNGKSIVDYKDTIVIDLSDYEQPVKVIRVFEVIFFLIGLMLITRSHMIKG